MAQAFNPLAPLAPLANTARTVTEQLNVTNKALSDSVATTAGQLLTSLSQGIPGLGGNGNTHNGNPNGGQAAGLPGLAALFPAGAIQAVSQLEEVIIPAGIPRPSALLTGVTGAPARQPVTDQPPPERETQPVPSAAPRVRQRSGY